MTPPTHVRTLVHALLWHTHSIQFNYPNLLTHPPGTHTLLLHWSLVVTILKHIIQVGIPAARNTHNLLHYLLSLYLPLYFLFRTNISSHTPTKSSPPPSATLTLAASHIHHSSISNLPHLSYCHHQHPDILSKHTHWPATHNTNIPLLTNYAHNIEIPTPWLHYDQHTCCTTSLSLQVYTAQHPGAHTHAHHYG